MLIVLYIMDRTDIHNANHTISTDEQAIANRDRLVTLTHCFQWLTEVETDCTLGKSFS